MEGLEKGLWVTLKHWEVCTQHWRTPLHPGCVQLIPVSFPACVPQHLHENLPSLPPSRAQLGPNCTQMLGEVAGPSGEGPMTATPNPPSAEEHQQSTGPTVLIR